MREKIINNLSNFLPIIIFAVTIGGALFGILVGKVDWSIKGIYLAIPAIVACYITYNFKGKILDLKENHNIYSINQHRINTFFLIVFLLSIIVMLLLSNNDAIINLFIILLYTIIAIQILFIEGISDNYLIFEILSVGALFIVKKTLFITSYFGGTDLLIHNNFNLITYLSNHIIPSELSGGYSAFPLFHIFCAEGMHILNLNVEMTTKLITWPLTAIIILLIIYSLFRIVTKNRIILLFSIFSLSILFLGSTLSVFMIPRSFSLFGFFLMLYLIFKIGKKSELAEKITFTICLIPVMIFIVLAHQISIILIFLLISLIIFCENIVNDKKFLSNKYVLFFFVISISYWIFNAFDFAKGVIDTRLYNSLAVDMVLTPSFIIEEKIDPLSFYFNNIGMLVVIFLIILAITYILQQRSMNYVTVLSLFGLVTMVLFINSPIQAFWEFTTLFSVGRFFILLSPFMAFLMGIGLVIFYSYLTKKYSSKAIVTFLFFSIILLYTVGTMHLVYDENRGKENFDLIELKGYSFVTNYIPFNKEIHTDYYTSRYFNQNYFNGIKELGIPHYSCKLIPNVQLLNKTSGYTIISVKQLYQGDFIIGEGNELKPGHVAQYSPSASNVNELNIILQKRNKLYSNRIIETFMI